MRFNEFPVIDQIATGKNILSLRKEKGLSVKDLQEYFGFEEPQAIYRWQYGKTLPSVDNLYALSALLDVPMERILVPVPNKKDVYDMKKQQEIPAAFVFLEVPLCRIHKEIGIGQRIDIVAVIPASGSDSVPHIIAVLSIGKQKNGSITFPAFSFVGSSPFIKFFTAFAKTSLLK